MDTIAFMKVVARKLPILFSKGRRGFLRSPPTVFFPALTVLSGYRGGKCIRSDPG